MEPQALPCGHASSRTGARSTRLRYWQRADLTYASLRDLSTSRKGARRMLTQSSPEVRFDVLGPFDGESNTLNVVIETPRGHRNKYSYDHGFGLFKLGGV